MALMHAHREQTEALKTLGLRVSFLVTRKEIEDAYSKMAGTFWGGFDEEARPLGGYPGTIW